MVRHPLFVREGSIVVKKSTKKLVLSALLALVPGFCACNALAGETIGYLYPMGEPSTSAARPAFTQTTVTKDLPNAKQETTQEETASIVDTSGKTVMTEHTLYSGSRLISQEVQQRQIGEAYEVALRGNEVEFKTYELKDDGTKKLVKSSSESNDGKLISGPLTVPFFREHWDELLKGETLKARFVVMEISGTVGFKFEKKSVTGNELVVEMKPSSFFINLLVDTIELTLDIPSRSLVHYKGRTPLKIFDGGKAKPFDSDISYKEVTPHDQHP